MPQRPDFKNGLSTSSGGRDIGPEDFLELLERAMRGLGNVARNFDAILTQLVESLKSLDTDSLVARIRSDLSVEKLASWHEVLQQAQSYEMRVSDLRVQSESLVANVPGGSSNADKDDEHLIELRRQLLGSIPASVWDEAVEGFGDPGLANV
jgi:hypothetical protein